MVRSQVLRRFIEDEEMELWHVLFDNGGHEHVICWQDFVFLTLEFVIVLEVCMLSGASDTSIVAYLFESDVWIIAIVAVEL